MRGSEPMPRRTSSMSAPIASARLASSFMNEMRVASMPLAAYLVSSAERTPITMMRSRLRWNGAYSWRSIAMARSSSAPTTTRSGRMKSTVPVGTADKVRLAIEEELKRRGAGVDFSVVSNPEFLKEGAAVEDFMRPDRVVVGAEDERAIAMLRQLYAPFQRNRDRIIVMGVRSAELTKYAANGMLATRISFMNELANLAEAIGADIEEVRRGIGSDPRIGYQFLYPGAGFGGSCFPKDVKALQRTATEVARPLRVINAVEAVNDAQKHVLAAKVARKFGANLHGKTFALWGLAFKANPDDRRGAGSRTVIAS